MSSVDAAVNPGSLPGHLSPVQQGLSSARRRLPLALAVVAAYCVLSVAGWAWRIGPVIHPYVLLSLGVALWAGWTEALVTSLVGVGLLALAASYGGTTVHPLTVACLLATPLGVGALLERRLRHVARLRNAVADSGQRILCLEEKMQALELANEHLRARASHEESSVEMIDHIARRLAVLEEADLYPTLVDVVAEAVGAEACSVYAVEGRSLKLMAEKGWAEVPPDARSVEAQDDLLGQVVTDKRVRTLREFPLERIIDADAPPMLRIMGAPVLHPVSGQVLAVLSVESLPFRRFTRSAATLLGLIGDLAGKAMVTVAADREDAPLATGLLNVAFFRRRLMAEIQGRQQGRLEQFAVGALQIKDLDKLPPEKGAIVERAVELLLEVNLRDTDVRARVDAGQYAFLLPTSSLENAHNVEKLLGAELACRSRDWLADCQAAAFHVGTAGQAEGDDPDNLLKRAFLQARPCEMFETSAGQQRPDLAVRHSRVRALLEGGGTDGLRQAREEYAIIRILEQRAAG